MGKKSKLTSQKFGRWTVLNDSGDRANDGAIFWNCICSCGNQKKVRTQALVHGASRSCGCLYDETRKTNNYRHGFEGTRIYKIWSGMIQRCTNPKYTYFKNYGGRGITICDDWKQFINFKNWAFETGYKDELTIDRLDVDKGYSPLNCKWSTKVEQARNTTLNVMISIGNETKCLKEWTEKFNLNYQTVQGRRRRGDSKELWFLTKEEYATKREALK